MDRLMRILASGRFLVVLLVVTIAVGIAFGFAGRGLGGPLLDMIADPAANGQRLGAMTAAQRNLHLWITLTLDMIYPIAYGGGLANFAARLATRGKWLAAAPGLALIAVDLFENMLIVMMLKGDADVIGLKGIVTEVKWWLFGGCALLVLVLAAAAFIRHHRGGALPGSGDRRVSGEY